MEHRRLGRTDLSVSSIGMGCVTFGREIGRDESFLVLDRALERGITLYDTAEAYGEGSSEEVLGAWIADRGVRDRIVLATKVHGTLTRERVIGSAQESLRRLRTDHVDLFQLHNWDAATPLEETLSGLDTLMRRGQVRWVGCSNLAAWQVCKSLWRQDALGLARFESVQPIYNLVHRDIEEELLPLCADQQLGVMTYSPLGAGFLSGKYRRGEAVPSGSRFDIKPGHQDIYFTDRGFRIMEGLRALAVEAGVPMPALALAWVMKRAGITSVLIGARSVGQVDQAFEAEALRISQSVSARLDAL